MHRQQQQSIAAYVVDIRRCGTLALCALLLPLVIAACSTVQTMPDTSQREPLRGTMLWTDEHAQPHLEVLLLKSPETARLGWNTDLRSFKVVRDSTALAQLVVPSSPIDFEQWLVIVPEFAVPLGSTASVQRVSSTDELVVWRSNADTLELRYTQPCAFCGGASYIAAEAQKCTEALPARLFLVPRDRAIKIGIVETRCAPDLS